MFCFRVEILPSKGIYDLHISNTSYSRDNAQFKCTMKQAGTGTLLHSSKVNINFLSRLVVCSVWLVVEEDCIQLT